MKTIKTYLSRHCGRSLSGAEARSLSEVEVRPQPPRLLGGLVWGACLLLGLASCVKDDPAPEPDCCPKGALVITLRNAEAGNPITREDDSRVEKLRIFVFHGEVLEANELFVLNPTDGTVPLASTITLDVAVGVKDIYAIANENADVTSALEAITTEGQLLDIWETLDPLTKPMQFHFVAPDSPDNRLLPLTGKAEGVRVENEYTTGAAAQANITLHHVTARLFFELALAEDEYTNIGGGIAPPRNIEVQKVTLVNSTKHSKQWENPEGELPGQEYYPTVLYSIDSTSNPYVANLRDDHSTYPYFLNLGDKLQIGPIYVYENLIGTRDPDRATRLEVIASDGGSQPKTYTLYMSGVPVDKGNPPVKLGNSWWATRNTVTDPITGEHRFVESPEMTGSLYKWDNGSLGTTEPTSNYNVWQTEEPCPPGYRLPKAVMNENSNEELFTETWYMGSPYINQELGTLNNVPGMYFKNSSNEEVFFPFVTMILPVEGTPYDDYYLYWIGNTEWLDPDVLLEHTVLVMKYDESVQAKIPGSAGLAELTGRDWSTYGAMELPVRCVYDGDWLADNPDTEAETIIDFQDTEAHYYQIRRGHSYDIKGLFLNTDTYIGINTQIAKWNVRDMGKRPIN